MIISVVEALVAQLDVPANINAVESNIKFDFNHGASHWANLVNDEYDFGDFQGVIFLDQPITTEYQLTSGGYIGEFYPITLFFMMKSDLDWTPQEHEENCIDPANNAIRQFISICQDRDDLVDEILNPTALEFTNLLDVNVSGKSLSIKIKPYINKSVCVPGFLPVCSPASILDSDGVTLFEVASGENGTCTPCTPCEDATVENSNASYSETVASGGNLALPNIDFTDSDGTTASVPSMENIVATPCVVQSGIVYQRPTWTGYILSYDLYDDAWQWLNGTYNYTPPANPISFARLDFTHADPFFNLVDNNAFGNKDRFTDENGLQVYGNDYVIDHITGLGWVKTVQIPTNNYYHWLTTAEAYTNSLGMNDFRCPNQNEQMGLYNFGKLNDRATMNYPPFNMPTGYFLMSTTTTPQNTGVSTGFNSPVVVFGDVTTQRLKASTNAASYFIRNHYN